MMLRPAHLLPFTIHHMQRLSSKSSVMSCSLDAEGDQERASRAFTRLKQQSVCWSLGPAAVMLWAGAAAGTCDARDTGNWKGKGTPKARLDPSCCIAGLQLHLVISSSCNSLRE
jgi:hypothetical protein